MTTDNAARIENGWHTVVKTHTTSDVIDHFQLYVEDGIIIKARHENEAPGRMVRYSRALSRFIGAGAVPYEEAVENGALREEFTVRGLVA